MNETGSKRFLAITLPLCAVVFFAVATLLYFLPDLRYRMAEEAFESGESERTIALLGDEDSERAASLRAKVYLAAAKAALSNGDEKTVLENLALLPESDDTRAIRRELAYREAVRMFDAGEWENAAEALQNIGTYRDSLALLDRARVGMAEELYAAGDAKTATELLLSVGGAENERRAAQIAVETTGLNDPEEAMRTLRGLDAETIARRKRIASLQQAAQDAVIAVGFSHTVGLQTDGTVVAVGDNTYGQCDVEAWTDVIAVAAGAYHTAALHSDGTVSAAGDNAYGQCDVSEWTNVVRIAANNFDTIGLKADGTLLHTGFHAYAETAEWPKDLVSIAAGSYGVCAVRKNGTMLSCFVSDRAPEFTDLTYAAVQTGYAVGLRRDGTLLCHNIELPARDDVVSVSCGTNRVLLLTDGGEVIECPFSERDGILAERVTDAAAIANGATHCAVVLSDGSVRTFGENTFGECNTADWRLKTYPKEP